MISFVVMDALAPARGVRAGLQTSVSLSATPFSWFFHGWPGVLNRFLCIYLIPWDCGGFFHGRFRVFLQDEHCVVFGILSLVLKTSGRIDSIHSYFLLRISLIWPELR